jgi:hypothetical protein
MLVFPLASNLLRWRPRLFDPNPIAVAATTTMELTNALRFMMTSFSVVQGEVRQQHSASR